MIYEFFECSSNILSGLSYLYTIGKETSWFLPCGKQTAGPCTVVPGIFRPFLPTHQQNNSWHCWSSYCPSGLHFGTNTPSRGGSKANLSRAECVSSWHFVRFTIQKIINGMSMSEEQWEVWWPHGLCACVHTLHQALQVCALARDIYLSSWARHLTLTMPLSARSICKWASENLILEVKPYHGLASYPGSRNTPFMLHIVNGRYALPWPEGTLWLYADLPF